MTKLTTMFATAALLLAISAPAMAGQTYDLSIPVSADLTGVTFNGNAITGLEVRCQLFNASNALLLTKAAPLDGLKVPQQNVLISITVPDGITPAKSYTCAFGFKIPSMGAGDNGYFFPAPGADLGNVVKASTFITRSGTL